MIRKQNGLELQKIINKVQAFLDFRDFQFNVVVYNSILFTSPLVLLSNLDLRGFCFRGFFVCFHIYGYLTFEFRLTETITIGPSIFQRKEGNPSWLWISKVSVE